MTRVTSTAPERAVASTTAADHAPTTAAPARPVPDAPAEERRERFLDLSLTQVLGGSLAAATAAALGSRLGLVGTITGAAVISLVSAVSASLYTQSMRRTRARMGTRRRLVGTEAAAGSAVPEPAHAGTASAAPARPAPAPRSRRIVRLRTGARALAAAVAVFAIAAGAVTAWELATGASLSGSDGTTFSEVARSRGAVAEEPETSGGTDQPEAVTSDPSAEPTDPAGSDGLATDSDAGSADPATETEPAPVETPSTEPTDPAESADPTAPADPTDTVVPADGG